MSTSYGEPGTGTERSGDPDAGGEGKSVGQLVSELTNDFSTLLHQEIALAKAEVKEEAAKAGKGAGMLAGAGVAAHLVLVFASLTLMWALGNVMNLAWAALIVTLLWAAIAAALGLIGKKTLATVNPKPEKTIDTLKEDAQWARNRSS